MDGAVWIQLLVITSLLSYGLSITNSRTHPLSSTTNYVDEDVGGEEGRDCLSRVEYALDQVSSRRSGPALDLTGYALHQQLRSAPLDMYVSGIRMKLPLSWGKVDRCRWNSSGSTLEARILFQDLTVSGSVHLYQDNLGKNIPPGNAQPDDDKCTMTARMRRPGLSFTVAPSPIGRSLRQMAITTATTFVEPQFVSLHSYGCAGVDVVKVAGAEGKQNSEERRLEMSQEMEEVFLNGVRALLTRYMEHTLQPVLRDTLMLNLGYTISYGR